jgi:hypothetical protein
MYAIWVYKGMAVVSDDIWPWLKYRVHSKAHCYTEPTKKAALRMCKMHSWKVVYSHLEEQEDDDV